MSPLIDVTNTVAQDVTLPCSRMSPTIEPKIVENGKYLSVKDSPKLAKETSSVTKCNNSKLSHPQRKRLSLKKSSKEPEVQSSSNLSTVCKQEPNSRVPPLPSDELTDALQSLNLEVEKVEGSYSERTKESETQGNSISGTTLTGSSKFVGPPPTVFSGTYQCIACGLELSTMDNLTNHLVKHIYEGLHAASWLNNAMSALLVPTSLSSISGSTSGIVSGCSSSVISESTSPEKNGDPKPVSLSPPSVTSEPQTDSSDLNGKT